MISLDKFDEVIHAPRRLAICAFLDTIDEASFSAIREALRISDSSLSKQITLLVEVGYVEVRKSAQTGRRQTWVRLTQSGKKAFRAHRAALMEVLAEIGGTGGA